MGKFGYHVIDADGHGGDLPNWFERLPERFRPQWEERRARIKQHFANLPGVGVKQTTGKAKLDMADRPGMTRPDRAPRRHGPRGHRPGGVLPGRRRRGVGGARPRLRDRRSAAR